MQRIPPTSTLPFHHPFSQTVQQVPQEQEPRRPQHQSSQQHLPKPLPSSTHQPPPNGTPLKRDSLQQSPSTSMAVATSAAGVTLPPLAPSQVSASSQMYSRKQGVLRDPTASSSSSMYSTASPATVPGSSGIMPQPPITRLPPLSAITASLEAQNSKASQHPSSQPSHPTPILLPPSYSTKTPPPLLHPTNYPDPKTSVLSGRIVKPTSHRLHNCQTCTSTFNHHSQLTHHVRSVHQKSRPHQCPLCPSTFSAKSDLRRHQQTLHDKLRPFTCTTCQATFQMKTHRDAHIATVHEKKKPFVCETCGVAFGLKWNLNNHIKRVHKRIAPFACNVCGSCFSSRYDQRRHQRLVHRKEQWECQVCKKGFAKKYELQRHVVVEHGCEDVTKDQKYQENVKTLGSPVSPRSPERPEISATGAAFIATSSIP